MHFCGRFFFFKQKTAYEMRISDWSSDVCSSDLVKAHAMASDVQVLDRSGELIERVRADFQVRRGDWLALQDISAAFQRAVILSEDQRFYTHAGVDWRGDRKSTRLNSSH